jgi:hypothetical protein
LELKAVVSTRCVANGIKLSQKASEIRASQSNPSHAVREKSRNWTDKSQGSNKRKLPVTKMYANSRRFFKEQQNALTQTDMDVEEADDRIRTKMSGTKGPQDSSLSHIL